MLYKMNYQWFWSIICHDFKGFVVCIGLFLFSKCYYFIHFFLNGTGYFINPGLANTITDIVTWVSGGLSIIVSYYYLWARYKAWRTKRLHKRENNFRDVI